MSENDRAPVSSGFAAIAGLTVAGFVWGVWAAGPPLEHWSHGLMLVWAAMLAVGLLIWAARPYAGIHWIGNPTLSMVAGVSGGAIAAVALAFTLSSGVEQTRVLKTQAATLEKQLNKMEELRQELKSIRDAVSSVNREPVAPPVTIRSGSRRQVPQPAGRPRR